MAAGWAGALARRRVRRELQGYEAPQARFTPLRMLQPGAGRADYHFRSLIQVNILPKPRA